jgi:glycosyltransferase involved in cell wall biosynthesis
MSGNGHSRDMIFCFTTSTWSDAHRRWMLMAPDRLATTLLHHRRVNNLLIADPYRGVAGAVKRRVTHADAAPPAGATLHSPLRLRRQDAIQLDRTERDYRRYGVALRRRSRRAGLDRPALIAMHPLVAGFADVGWTDRPVFYIDDDWASHPDYEPWWPLYREAYARVRDSGMAVCAVSQTLLERIQPTGPTAVIPNGVDPKEWAAFDEPPDWFAPLPGPRILYVGTVDQRLDKRQLEQLADAYPESSLVLAGYLPSRAPFARLLARPNVTWHPTVPRPEVTSLMGAADVCIVPHRETPLTTAMSPLKVYEYLAAGRPVVATDLPPMRELGPRVRLVPPGEDLSTEVAAALSDGPLAEDKRLEFVAENSWAKRHERVLALAFS